MRVLLIGVGQLGLGLIVPVFTEAGYKVVGTDANPQRLQELEGGYFLETPSRISKLDVTTTKMDEAGNDFDLVVTSVGRQHIAEVAKWYREKGILAPVLLAENLPDPISLFPRQISIVVDRICPRVVSKYGLLTAVAEDYFKIVTLDDPLTHQLGKIEGVELELTEAGVELKRKQKMFTVNTSHVITALYGQQLGCLLVEEAVAKSEVASKICSIVTEISPWLGLNQRQADTRAGELIRRFSSPIKDSLSRILGPANKKSALHYVEVPLQGLRAMGREAPVLEEAYRLLAV
ncbi:MAG: hypothetical protein HYW89_00275 [Candidatus Sungiibacteriota bacterium]|uniref:Pyrroline-5-carboxylate reductase catalytic N-terminal domain-containing protein n=1 Tax=Candidatus Sungiibacteriota bacterium TaxID=2750080 RepID=A0A7T5UPY7_9BACT|nr:MAG: hypothetical protein HYW89_00275 [Candidatus Sungbacteria bacterium]